MSRRTRALAALIDTGDDTDLDDVLPIVTRRLRDHYRSNLFDFCRDVLGFSDMEREVHGELCTRLENAYWGRSTVPPSGGISRHMNLLPRGTFKTSIETTGFVLWVLTQDDPMWLPEFADQEPGWTPPTSFNKKKGYNQRFLIGTEVDKYADKFLNACKEHITSNQRFIEIYGRLDKTVGKARLKWSKDGFNLSWRDDFASRDYNVATVSLDGAVNSVHTDINIFDDLFCNNQTDSPGGIAKTYGFYKRILPVAENPSILLLTGVRWHDADLFGHLMKTEAEKWNIYIERAIRTPQEIAEGKTELFFPSRLTHEVLADKRSSMSDYEFSCNPGEAPILMADWTMKPIRDVVVGDVVVGFTIDGGIGKGQRSRLVKSTVTGVGSKVAKVQKVIVEDGHTIRCTPDHKWYTARTRRQNYAELGLKKKNGQTNRLMRVVGVYDRPDQDEMGDWRYLAGIIDGEGCCRGSCVQITQSQDKNPDVCKEIYGVLSRLGLEYSVWSGPSGVSRGHADIITINDGRDFKVKINSFGRPAKTAQIAESVLSHKAGRPISKKLRVLSIEPDGEDTVYSLQTTTGNYVVWGYASKNCNYLNSPIDQSTALFKESYFGDDVWYDLPANPEGLRAFLAGKYVYTTIDPAIDDDAQACNTVVLTCAWDMDGRVWTLDMLRQRGLSPGDLIDEIFRQHALWKPMGIGIEEQVYQKALMFYVSRKSREEKVYPFVQPLKHGGRSKERRIAGLEPLAKAGRLRFRRGHEELVNEMKRYPRADYNDAIDAFAYQLDIANMPAIRTMTEEKPKVPTKADVDHQFADHLRMLGIGFDGGADVRDHWMAY